MREVLLWLVRPLMRRWLAQADRQLQKVTRPNDEPQALVPGADSDRILLIGSGPAAGWGVSSHADSLPGALARGLSARTGRGAVVDVIPDPHLYASSTIHLIDDSKLWRYDAVLLLVGINDAVALTSTAEWKRSMRTLLEHIEDETSLSAQVFVVGIPPVRQLRVYQGALGRIAERHARVLNKCSKALAQSLKRTTFVSFAPVAEKPKNHYRSPDEYQSWAQLLVEEIAQPLTDNHVFEPVAVEVAVEPAVIAAPSTVNPRSAQAPVEEREAVAVSR